MSEPKPDKTKALLPVFCFKVQIGIPGATGEMLFKSAGGLKFETEAVDVRAGGVNNTTFKLIGATKFANLVFKRGFCVSSEIVAWRQAWLKPGGPRPARANGVVIQLGNDMEAIGYWHFTRAWPLKFELAELDASKSEFAIETLELAHEGLAFSSSASRPSDWL